MVSMSSAMICSSIAVTSVVSVVSETVSIAVVSEAAVSMAVVSEAAVSEVSDVMVAVVSIAVVSETVSEAVVSEAMASIAVVSMVSVVMDGGVMLLDDNLLLDWRNFFDLDLFFLHVIVYCDGGAKVSLVVQSGSESMESVSVVSMVSVVSVVSVVSMGSEAASAVWGKTSVAVVSSTSHDLDNFVLVTALVLITLWYVTIISVVAVVTNRATVVVVVAVWCFPGTDHADNCCRKCKSVHKFYCFLNSNLKSPCFIESFQRIIQLFSVLTCSSPVFRELNQK